MTKAEITEKIDEIIEFSGCERYIDTPVKRYSSGMTVRLAFAVAAFLEPDILVIDEVLAVGDAEFQKKAVGKMQDISRGDGRTVLFVSHNMNAVKNLCTRTVVLEHGHIVFNGDTEEAIKNYLLKVENTVTHVNWGESDAPGDLNTKIKSVKLSTANNLFEIENEIFVEIEYLNLLNGQVLNASVSVFNENGVYVFSSPNLDRKPLNKGLYKSILTIPKDFLNTGKYFFTILLVGNNYKILAQLDEILVVDVDESGTNRKNYFGFWGGIVRPDLKWENNIIANN